jgi:hydrogenase nickel incorporation protein HypA/HybF
MNLIDMHELGIAMRIAEIATRVAKQEGLQKVDAVLVEVGELSGIVPEALLFSFESATKNSFLENTKLEINMIPAGAKCNTCLTKFRPEGFFSFCPACEGVDCEIIAGKELFIKSLVSENGQ